MTRRRPRIVVAVGPCAWCGRESLHMVGPWPACWDHAGARHAPLNHSRPGPAVPTDAAPDPSASVGNAEVPGRGSSGGRT